MIKEKDVLAWLNVRCGVNYQAVEQCQSGYVHGLIMKSYYPDFRFKQPAPREVSATGLNAAEKSDNFDIFVEMCREVDIHIPPTVHEHVPAAILGNAQANAAIVGWLHQYFTATPSAPTNTVSKHAMQALPPFSWTQPLPEVALTGALPTTIDDAVAVNAYADTLSAVVQDALAFAALLKADTKDTAALSGAVESKLRKAAAPPPPARRRQSRSRR